MLSSRMIAMAAIVMIVVAGLCLLDGDRESTDLCLISLIAVLLGMSGSLAVTRYPGPALATGHLSAFPDLPSPPPKD